VSWATADFLGAPEAAREAVRTFIEERTDGRVRDLVPDELPHNLTALLLVHATYFRGTWKHEFEESATKEAPFHLSAREVVTVPLMHQEETFPYAERASFQVVELPHQGGGAGDGSFSMVIILPKERHGLPRLEASLRFDDLQQVLSGLRPRQVRLRLPRFRIESDVDLRRELHDLGVRRAFRGRGSPFANLTSDAVYLESVRQRARVSVDEKGTEAMAVVEECVIFFGASAPVAFRADHPFLFLIRHRETGTILFLGRVADPRA
jgi:serpin B